MQNKCCFCKFCITLLHLNLHLLDIFKCYTAQLFTGHWRYTIGLQVFIWSKKMTELGWFPLSAWLPPPWCLRKGPSHQGCSETSTFNITLMTAEYSTFNSLIINVAIPPQHPQLPGNFMRKECLLCQTVVTVGI